MDEKVEQLKKKVLKIRKIIYLLESEPFRSAYDKATQNDVDFLNSIIDEFDFKSLECWLEENKGLEHMPMRLLKIEAHKLGIDQVWKFDRADLLYLIKRKQADEKERKSRTDCKLQSNS